MLLGIQYLKDTRHLTDEVIRKFNLGWCDAKGFIYIGTNFKENMALDFKFQSSVLFPIFDMYGSFVGVSARSLDRKADAPKYVNTVYAKANNLYGLNFTWQDCLKENKAYVVEGNVDALMMWQSGIKNVVGMLGSNIHPTQVCLLSRFVDHIVFVPDGDKAGEKFLQKLKYNMPSKFYNGGTVKFSIVNLPEGYDPDKFLQEKSATELKMLERPLFKTLDEMTKEL